MSTRLISAMHLSVAVSACLVFTAAHAAPAAEPKPVVSLNLKSAEIKVTIDDGFKAYPGLYENLAAEGKAQAARWRSEADTVLRTNADPFTFKDGRKYDYSRSYTLRSAIGRYVSVVRADGTFTGGAHPNYTIDTILWDTSAKKRISIRPFFKETADKGPAMTAMAKLVRDAVVAEKKRRNLDTTDPNEWLKDITPSLLKLGPVTLAPSDEAGKSAGLSFHFSPYAVGPYAEGSLTTFVPWTEFKEFLSPEGIALFGGKRAPGDEKIDDSN
jgi:uncharacterized protein DUF3298